MGNSDSEYFGRNLDLKPKRPEIPEGTFDENKTLIIPKTGGTDVGTG